MRKKVSHSCFKRCREGNVAVRKVWRDVVISGGAVVLEVHLQILLNLGGF